MTEQLEDLENEAAKRLAAEVEESQARNKFGRQRVGARQLVGSSVLALVVAGALAFAFWPKHDASEADIATAEADPFQTKDASPFGNMKMPERQTVKEVETDPALLAQIEALKAEIERLKQEPKPQDAVEVVSDTPKDDGSAALLARLEGLQAALSDSQDQATKEREDRAREMAALRAELDAARLGGQPATGDMGETDRLEDAKQEYQKRIKSGMIAYGGSGGSTGNAGAGEDAGYEEPHSNDPQRRMSGNEQFARAKAVRAPVERAKVIASPANTITQGTMIQAALETMIDTDLPGAIRAVVTENVHSYDGSQVLIPRGSHVIGVYNDQVAMAQRRAMVVWNRIILPDNQTVDIGAYGGDAIGRAGVGGKVRTHALQRFGSAALVSLISLGPGLALSSDDNGSSDTAGAVSQALTGGVGDTLSGYLNRPPSISVAQGSLVTIMVDRDLEIF